MVNLQEGLIERYSLPSPTGYAKVDRFARGATLSPIAFADIAIPVSDIVPVP